MEEPETIFRRSDGSKFARDYKGAVGEGGFASSSAPSRSTSFSRFSCFAESASSRSSWSYEGTKRESAQRTPRLCVDVQTNMVCDKHLLNASGSSSNLMS